MRYCILICLPPSCQIRSECIPSTSQPLVLYSCYDSLNLSNTAMHKHSKPATGDCWNQRPPLPNDQIFPGKFTKALSTATTAQCDKRLYKQADLPVYTIFRILLLGSLTNALTSVSHLESYATSRGFWTCKFDVTLQAVFVLPCS